MHLSRLIDQIYERHNPTVFTMAKGIFEFRKSLGIKPGQPMPAAIEVSHRAMASIDVCCPAGPHKYDGSIMQDDVHNYLDVFFTVSAAYSSSFSLLVFSLWVRPYRVELAFGHSSLSTQHCTSHLAGHLLA